MKFLDILETLLAKVYDSRTLSSFFENAWYSYVSKLDRNGEATFLNYGYTDKNDRAIQLRPEDERNRYHIQLYHHLATAVPLKDKEILEIGCGRGGGASYIARYLHPKNIIATDLCKAAIAFNERYYNNHTNLQFRVADAHNIPFEDNCFDIIFNIESSRLYSDMEKFLSEVHRVLSPGGYFLWTCYWKENDISRLKVDLLNSGMKLIKEEDITLNVIEAVDLDSERREKLIRKLAPRILRMLCEEVWAIKGSQLYNSFSTREEIYLNFVLQKHY